MKRRGFLPLWVAVLLACLTGCGATGEKTGSLALIYGILAGLSALLLLAYILIRRKKEIWFVMLFSSVLVVNAGYFLLAVSQNLSQALMANRVAYLGSVFLPVSILMIIARVCKCRYGRWLPGVLLGLGVLVFFVAASPGYLTIYYKEVSFEIVNGVAMLKKVYGSWHILYLFYLLGYFGAMVTVILRSILQRRIRSAANAVVLAAAVFVNIGVWLIEQLTKIDFEILSVSYFISELFLLALSYVMDENEKLQETIVQTAPAEAAQSLQQVSQEQLDNFCAGVAELTKTERAVYQAYLDGKSTKEVMAELNIKENTLKFHNKNLYGKLHVSSRKQLVRYAALLQKEDPT